MKKKLIKISSVILSLVMILSMFTGATFADTKIKVKTTDLRYWGANA